MLEFLFATDLILGCGDAELDSEAAAAPEVCSQIKFFTFFRTLWYTGLHKILEGRTNRPTDKIVLYLVSVDISMKCILVDSV